MQYNSVSVLGVGDLRDALGMVLQDGWKLNPPEVRSRLVEVPGRSGSLDLSEALGGPFYGDRHQEMTFLVLDRDRATARRRVIEALHGQRLCYSFTMDPDHFYYGRWSVGEISWLPPNASVFTVTIIADAWRYREERGYRLNPVGGRMYYLESGDMTVKPEITCETPVRVEFEGKTTLVPAGTWRLNNVVFKRGVNKLYLNSWSIQTTSLNYLCSMTLDEMCAYTLDELERLASDRGVVATTLDDMCSMTLDEMCAYTLDELAWRQTGDELTRPPIDASVYLKYEWGDL